MTRMQGLHVIKPRVDAITYVRCALLDDGTHLDVLDEGATRTTVVVCPPDRGVTLEIELHVAGVPVTVDGIRQTRGLSGDFLEEYHLPGKTMNDYLDELRKRVFFELTSVLGGRRVYELKHAAIIVHLSSNEIKGLAETSGQLAHFPPVANATDRPSFL